MGRMKPSERAPISVEISAIVSRNPGFHPIELFSLHNRAPKAFVNTGRQVRTYFPEPRFWPTSGLPYGS
jgi:hypothetical protein